MDIYHIWADKEGDISDSDWVDNMRGFLDHLVNENKMISYRITRCKMGFRSIQDLPEWHIMMEFQDMAQLELAFKRVGFFGLLARQTGLAHSIAQLDFGGNLVP